MSEYMERHQMSRLIRTSSGYRNCEDGGQLAEAVRNQPYSAVLFDEIEKAHPDVLTILLQVLDDARLTDGHGCVADFSSSIVILTSNIGQEHLARNIYASKGDIEAVLCIRALLASSGRKFGQSWRT
ncbi:hypothetical protein DL89DRAFT_265830 [Linderina pennispora]|uniref:ATPase AAA-type core domain-containing protein n=1 Tax=Linderina pennispora TaxID=61395 RepID=A0A1Y1WF82_9FUNG|nr:uncharacterized protein DL89DRAFT_265830 [Linderina pennispora]ORX72210.1 hypothetical protein DL89DRAFT_265830 [Linderina pennispora]